MTAHYYFVKCEGGGWEGVKTVMEEGLKNEGGLFSLQSKRLECIHVSRVRSPWEGGVKATVHGTRDTANQYWEERQLGLLVSMEILN